MTRESAACRVPETLENACSTFSWLIMLKCGGWPTVSVVNYAHSTSKPLLNAAELSGSFSTRISITVATI